MAQDKCSKCGEIVKHIDAGFSPALQGMGHDCGGKWVPDAPPGWDDPDAPTPPRRHPVGGHSPATGEERKMAIPLCAYCATHYGDTLPCDEGKPVASPHRRGAPPPHPTTHPYRLCAEGVVCAVCGMWPHDSDCPIEISQGKSR